MHVEDGNDSTADHTRHGTPLEEQRAYAELGTAEHTLGDYRLIRRIGAGGVGQVWLAVQKDLQRTVALKLLHPKDQATIEHRHRFLEEARFAARLQHPNIVTVLDYGHHVGRLYYVMEYVDGATIDTVIDALSALVSHRDPLLILRLPLEIQHTLGVDTARRTLLQGFVPEENGTDVERAKYDASGRYREASPEALAFREARTAIQRIATNFLVESTIEVAHALEYAHGTGIIHGDIKPSNLILNRHGRIRVLDFGLAKLRGRHSGKRHALEGTPQYMSPEQIAGTSDAFSPSIDVYALGAYIYEVLTLRPMYAPGPSMEVFQRIATEGPPLPRKLNARIHRSLEAIVIKATARAPRNRYASMDELADDLQRFLRHQSVSALRGRRSLGDIFHEIRINRVLQIVGVLLAIVAIATGIRAYTSVRAGFQARAERKAALARAAQALDDADRLCLDIQAPIDQDASVDQRQLRGWAFMLADHAQRAHESLADVHGAGLFSSVPQEDVAALERRAWRVDVLRAAFVGRELEFESELHAGNIRGWDFADVFPLLTAVHCLGGLEVRFAHATNVVVAIVWIDPLTKESGHVAVITGPSPLTADRLLAGEYMVRVRDDAGREISFPYFVAAGADSTITVPIAPKEVPEGMCYVPSYPGEEQIIGDEVTRQGDLESSQSVVRRTGVKMTGSFFIDRYETTNAEFEHFMNSQRAHALVAQAVDDFEGTVEDAEQADERSHFVDRIMDASPEDWTFGRPSSGAELLPVTVPQAYLGEAFALFMDKSLPNETQWEKAARGIDGRSFVYGDVFRPGAHFATERLPGGSRPIDISVYGVMDTMASVPEWTRTASGQGHIVRGGDFKSTNPFGLRLAIRRPAGYSGLRLISRVVAPDLVVVQRRR